MVLTMPRPLRIPHAGYIHHVTCRGNDRQNIFLSDADFLQYCQLFEQFRKDLNSKNRLKVYNFCLMENHLHLLVEPTKDGALSKVMEEVSKAYAKYFNQKYDRMGHVFQGRYKSFLVQAERYFFACSRYIDLNPVKAGIAKDPKEYKWSGFNTLANGKDSPITIDFHEVYEGLGRNAAERQIAYRAFTFSYQMEELDLFNKRVCVLGDNEFKEKVASIKV